MNYSVRIAHRAKADLRESLRWWTENRSEEQAVRWYVEIHDAIQTLAELPQRCPLARESADATEELRELHFGLGSRPTHRIIFVINPDAVRVLAIRHTAQDEWDLD